MQDEIFMRQALQQASFAARANEVPVGAVLVYEGKVIAKAYNQVELLQDATAHAEMLCMTMGSSVLQNWRLADCTLYCTLEPCSMCLGAMLLARVKRLVWGAPDLRHGANGSWVNLLQTAHPTHQIEVTSHIMAAECAELMRTFFQKRRQEQ